ncbi:penicillin-binding transpeptidase domain-containing protein [Nocardioides speluncae]|uniref:penicillin-binding transpeptidase domain-containing protein n=1 Tax=Nocardioides speluncae TaxID=2670337 RepID=UPI0014755BBC|nr:penicillin-binding transpeptidase domain-containing protein [Nocardioides speluncae]
MSRRTSASLLTSVLLATAGLAACSGEDGPSTQDAADDLAAGLAGRDLAGVEATDGADLQKAFETITDDLADIPVEVTATRVEENGDKATATLTWTWDVAGKEWAYESSADLEKNGDDWLVDWRSTIVEPSLADGEVLDAVTLTPERGDILGAAKDKLVTDRAVIRYGLDKTKTEKANHESSARAIAQALDIQVAPYLKLVEAAGAQAFVEALVLRATDARETVPASYADIPGAVAYPTTIPLAPTREWAAPLLGTVGEATKEVIDKSDGKVQAGDQVGLSGLQARYEAELRGTPGLLIEAGSKKGKDRELFSTPATPGKPLQTTLDLNLQTLAEQTLADVTPASALVAIRPSSGDILAAASGPGANGLNAATFGQYAPGSTFKAVTTLALLRAGLTPDSPVSCTPTVTVDGKSFKNYDDYPSGALGRIPLKQAFAESCNTALISARDKLKPGDLIDAGAALGIGVDHDLGFPAYFGSVPEPESETEDAASLIGQGKVLASPMAMAAVAASVNAGHTVLPRLITGHEVTQTVPASPLTKAEADQLRSLMRGVVTGGSGEFLADVPGAPVIAKTGTAEFGSGTDLPTHAWMIAAQGDLAVAVFVERGESGSRTAGPLLEEFLRNAAS